MNYRVKQGECINSIAYRYGLDADTIWNHPNNSNLKASRNKERNILLAGDILFIPLKEHKNFVGMPNHHYRFRRKGVTSKLQIQILDENEQPCAGIKYLLSVGTMMVRSMTNEDGWVIAAIPPNERSGKLTILNNGEAEECDLSLGYLDPLDTDTGLSQRLFNLGYTSTDYTKEHGFKNDKKEALLNFQIDHGLEETGELDDRTLSVIKEVYGC